MMKKISFFIFIFFVLFSCKQNSNSVKSILKIHNISIDGISMNESSLKKGDATIDYQDSHFDLKVDAELLNVKAFFSLGNSKREITKNILNGTPYTVNTDKDILCKISFEGEEISTEYKFKIHCVQKNQNMAPSLKSLTIGEKTITEIKDEMSVFLSSFSQRLPISWQTDRECNVSISPELDEGMVNCSFDRETEIKINLVGKVTKTYKLVVRLADANSTDDELRLIFLKVYDKEIRPIKDRNDFILSHDAPYNIPLEVLANNGGTVETEPPIQNGKIGMPFNKKENMVKITCKKDGFAPRSYFLNIKREEERAELRSLKVNGHIIEIKDEMNVNTTYAKAKALIEAVGKFGTDVSFNPSLDSENKIDLTEGVLKKIEITVSKPGVLSHVYTLNLTRKNVPSSPRPSTVESIMIAIGHDAVRNFSEIDKDFPSTKETVKYEITRANQYTLRVEKLNASDVINVFGADGQEIALTKTEGLISFYNLTLKEVDSAKSSIEEIKIKIQEHNMQEKTVSCKMCFQGAWAEALKRPKAIIGSKTFEPLITKMNYLSEGGRLKLELAAYDPLSTLKQEDGSDFPAEIYVGDDVAEIGFVITTVTDREVRTKVRFKKAVAEERTLLEYLKFYPKKIDIGDDGYIKEYSERLSPLFTSDVQEYRLELKAGDDKIFFDAAPIIKEADIRVRINGQLADREEYFKNNNGSKIDLYALSMSPKESRTLSIEIISDLNSSISKTYTITVVSPDDDIVADFDATFFDSNGRLLLTVPAIGKGGIRLPPQDHNGGEIKIKLEAKVSGVTFKAKQAVAKFNNKGKLEGFEKEKIITLDSENTGTITTEIGMNYIAVQAVARNGFSKVLKTFEVYKFTSANKVRFELNDAKNTKKIDPTHYQMIETLNLSAPITFKGFGGTRFAVLPFLDVKGNKPFKAKMVNYTEYTLEKVPKLIVIGVTMPDNAQLYYAIFAK